MRRPRGPEYGGEHESNRLHKDFFYHILEEGTDKYGIVAADAYGGA